MDGDASDRLAVTWSLGQNLANTVGCPSARIIYLGRVYLGPQRPHLGLAHVPAYRPENLHFQWLFCNNSLTRSPPPLVASSPTVSRSVSHTFRRPPLLGPLALPRPAFPIKAHRRGLFRIPLFGSLAVSRAPTNGGTLVNYASRLL